MTEVNVQMTALLAVLCLTLGLLIGAAAFSTQTEIETPIIVEKLVQANATALPDYLLSQSEFEAEAEEAQALELALDSVESRDFKIAVFDALVLFGEDIEDYKDIESIIYEFDVDGNEIEFSKVKVYYFIDGDVDESQKGLMNEFTVEVDDLDFDDLSEAEVDETFLDSLAIAKVYL